MFEDTHDEAFAILMRRYRNRPEDVRAVSKGAWWVDSETGELIMPFYNEDGERHILSGSEMRSMMGLCNVVEERDIWEHVGQLRNRAVDAMDPPMQSDCACDGDRSADVPAVSLVRPLRSPPIARVNVTGKPEHSSQIAVRKSA